ncbi:hypothetical protein [Rhizobium sullae]|uniref:Uncharacterized protein n=1 Tax=Rhizobium sullae TaxID=50338 RepID=A0A4R3QBR1_RHISU|nr:hypothetical protein [Rhizobium sullae]TCU18801.1 hypothetical protein EV132_10228 [Rhizobium sullae]
MTIEKELSEAVEYVTGGDLDKLPLEKLFNFMVVTRGMADLAETELKRRGAYPFPAWRSATNR